jgi:hypothetical protein
MPPRAARDGADDLVAQGEQSGDGAGWLWRRTHRTLPRRRAPQPGWCGSAVCSARPRRPELSHEAATPAHCVVAPRDVTSRSVIASTSRCHLSRHRAVAVHRSTSYARVRRDGDHLSLGVSSLELTREDFRRLRIVRVVRRVCCFRTRRRRGPGRRDGARWPRASGPGQSR